MLPAPSGRWLDAAAAWLRSRYASAGLSYLPAILGSREVDADDDVAGEALWLGKQTRTGRQSEATYREDPA